MGAVSILEDEDDRRNDALHLLGGELPTPRAITRAFDGDARVRPLHKSTAEQQESDERRWAELLRRRWEKRRIDELLCRDEQRRLAEQLRWQNEAWKRQRDRRRDAKTGPGGPTQRRWTRWPEGKRSVVRVQRVSHQPPLGGPREIWLKIWGPEGLTQRPAEDNDVRVFTAQYPLFSCVWADDPPYLFCLAEWRYREWHLLRLVEHSSAAA
jgi:hypothetical protein